MNIKEAKEQIKDACRLYLKKDSNDCYVIPVNRQRPIFLIGAPGLGKSAVMEQIAEELDLALVSYSMTHHTRQSALGLPVITTEEYAGETYEVSRYTMSEIIASIYDVMKKSSKKEGILFLDEINCVSETLTPSMLLFLQYKMFGSYRVPDGWVIVTAGNPPEYNRAVREFDVVTLDRMRVIPVEPDYEVFREYAKNRDLHPAVVTYLDLKKEHFYVVNRDTQGARYVTGRGWEDLSEMILLAETEKIEVSQSLVYQYLHHKEIAQDFYNYYQLFHKYREDYKIDQILAGSVEETIIQRAANAAFDERLSLMALLVDALSKEMEGILLNASCLSSLSELWKQMKECDDWKMLITTKQNELNKQLKDKKDANILSREEQGRIYEVLRFLQNENIEEKNDYLECLQTRIEKARENTGKLKEQIANVFNFTQKAFGDGTEILWLVTEFSVRKNASQFLATFGCEAYKQWSSKLALTDRNKELQERWNRLEQ